MENEKYFETLAAHLEQDASVRNVYGEPIQVKGKTIIPVAKIAVGMGTGYGQKHGNGKLQLPFARSNNEEATGNGGGAGGGMVAYPQGVFEITENKTRFISASPFRYMLIGGLAGMLFARIIQRKKLKS